jgi:hypothetical protein
MLIPEHILRQHMYHVQHPNSIVNEDIKYKKETNAKLQYTIIDFFFNPGHEVTYPAKSYADAIVYAHLIDKYFDIPFDTSLRDPDLLYDDPYYLPYDKNPKVYDVALKFIKLNSPKELQYNLPQVITTVENFEKEFYINPNLYFNNANLHK